jgi:hypothetical protein
MTHNIEGHIYVNWVVTGKVGWGRVGRGDVGTHSEQMSPAFQLVYTKVNSFPLVLSSLYSRGLAYRVNAASYEV